MGAVAAALIAFAADPGTARAEPGANLALAQGILAGFGMDSEIEAIAQEAVAYLEAQREHIAPGHREPLRAIVKAGFRSETLYALTLDAFLERYEPRHAAAAAAWLERPETRQLLEQGRALDPATNCRPRTPLHRWGRMRSAERYALVGRVGGDTSASARAVQRASLVFGGMLAAGNATLPEAEQLTSPELEQMILAQHARLAAEYATDSRTLDCTYRGVDLETLREAARFLEGDAGRWMLDSVDAALGRALLLAAEATAVHVVRTFGEGARPSAELRSARALLPDASGAAEPGTEPSLEKSAQSRHAPGAIPGRRP
jgi:hypothetical protein